jgi:hypothetical protein
MSKQLADVSIFLRPVLEALRVSLFFKSAHSHYKPDPLLQDHAPELTNRMLQRALCSDNFPMANRRIDEVGIDVLLGLALSLEDYPGIVVGQDVDVAVQLVDSRFIIHPSLMRFRVRKPVEVVEFRLEVT